MNQKGVMLIDVMLSLSLLFLVVSFFPLFIQFSPAVTSHTSSLYEKTIFFNQLSMEIREATSLQVKDGVFVIMKADGTTVSYEMYGSFLRRRVQGLGHEIILTKVKNVLYHDANHGIVIKVIDEQGKEYVKRFALPYVLTVNKAG